MTSLQPSYLAEELIFLRKRVYLCLLPGDYLVLGKGAAQRAPPFVRRHAFARPSFVEPIGVCPLESRPSDRVDVEAGVAENLDGMDAFVVPLDEFEFEPVAELDGFRRYLPDVWIRRQKRDLLFA